MSNANTAAHDPQATGGGDDAELLRLAGEFQRRHVHLTEMNNREVAGDDAAAAVEDEGEETELDKTNDAWWAALRELIDLPPRTSAGLHAKAAAALAAMLLIQSPGRDETFDEAVSDDLRLVASVLRDVTGRA